MSLPMRPGESTVHPRAGVNPVYASRAALDDAARMLPAGAMRETLSRLPTVHKFPGCKVCVDPMRAEIDSKLERGKPSRNRIAHEHAYQLGAINAHARHHK
jgi:hypothetical protein